MAGRVHGRSRSTNSRGQVVPVPNSHHQTTEVAPCLEAGQHRSDTTILRNQSMEVLWDAWHSGSRILSLDHRPNKCIISSQGTCLNCQLFRASIELCRLLSTSLFAAASRRTCPITFSIAKNATITSYTTVGSG